MSAEDGDFDEALYDSSFGEMPCLICKKIFFNDDGALRFCDDCFEELEVDDGLSMEEMVDYEEKLLKAEEENG